MPRVRANCSLHPARGPGTATQELRDARATGRRDAIEGRNGVHATGWDCGANDGSAKPSYGEERFLGELELIIR
jgi:hypothetical protein